VLIPNRTLGDVLANLGALALGLASYLPVVVIVLFALALFAFHWVGS
jgi:hypothetical protein